MDLDQVFSTEWHSTTSSPGMRKALRRWQTDSGGIITVRTADELVNLLDHGGKGRPESRWLLRTAGSDEHARRVLFQSMQAMIKTQAQKRWGINRARYSADEWFAMCVTSGWIAVGSLAGREIAWPMWQLRAVMVRELTAMQNLSEVDTLAFDPSLLSRMPARFDVCVELGRVLIEAARSGLITRDEAILVWRTRSGFVSVSQLARERNLSVGLLIDRRKAAEVRLSDWAAA